MKRNYQIVWLLLGLALALLGLFWVKTWQVPQGILRTLPYVCIGLGCGLFGQGVGSLYNRHVMRCYPDVAQRQQVEVNDERNIALTNRAKAKGYDCMTVVFGALMVAFALMGAAFTFIVPLVVAYLFVVGSAVYYRIRFEKEM